MLLALTVAAALAAEPTDPEQAARRHQTAGAVALTAGSAATAGGLVVLLVGRGRPGELSDESQLTSDVRSIGGMGLVIGGLTTALVGGAEIGKAKALRRGAQVAPAMLPGGAGLVVAGTF